MSPRRRAPGVLVAVVCAAAAATAAAMADGSGAVIRPQVAVPVPPVSPAQASSPASCNADRLAGSALPGTTIETVEPVPAGGFRPPRGRGAATDVGAFCRVHARAATSDDSRVEFEVWLPDDWNGKIVATGNGGYGNTPNYGDMTYAMSLGYAVVGGDTGHQTPTPDDLLWGVDHPERIADWGSRSIHAIIGPARLIVEHLRGSAPSRSYFYGCSTGGHQAYAEIQRYPEDFDGVIAGAPGNNRIRLNVGFLWQFLANRRAGNDTDTILPAAKLPIVTRAVVAACDATDGVADGVVDDPRACTFDPAMLRCAAADGTDCLQDEEIAALERMYAGPVNPRTGASLYPGWPLSSEALTVQPDGNPGSGWHQYWGRGGEPARAAFWQHWVFRNPDWDWWSFDFDRDVALADTRLGELIDQVNPEIGPFKEAGGKAIVYQGWQDPVVNALDTIAYYEAVRARQGSQVETDEFFRLFLVPGMGHCGGGTGTTAFGNQGSRPPVVDDAHDLLSALDAWVERGRAPDRLIASRVEDGAVTRTRPLCPYPRRAVYSGRGSSDAETSYACQMP